MSPVHPIRGLFFDFDGLILDTEVAAFEAWREIYEEHGGTLTVDAWSRELGGSGAEIDHVAELEQAAGRALDRDEIYRRRLERKIALIEAEQALPGILDYVAEAQRLRLKLAVVSSSPHSWVDGYLATLGLADHFEAVICAEDAPRSKPYPDLYLRALGATGLRADEVIVFEDSPNGITAAQAAGIFCVAVPNAISSQLSTDHADLRLSSLADVTLQELLDRVTRRRNAAR
jgi:HAD superfamily hydrolase (TIGR01509 family)